MACFAVVVVLFVVQVQSQTMMMKRSLRRKKRKNLAVILELVAPLLVLHVHEFVGQVLLLQALFLVVADHQIHPVVVVRPLAYGWRFSLPLQ